MAAGQAESGPVAGENVARASVVFAVAAGPVVIADVLAAAAAAAFVVVVVVDAVAADEDDEVGAVPMVAHEPECEFGWPFVVLVADLKYAWPPIRSVAFAAVLETRPAGRALLASHAQATGAQDCLPRPSVQQSHAAVVLAFLDAAGLPHQVA